MVKPIGEDELSVSVFAIDTTIVFRVTTVFAELIIVDCGIVLPDSLLNGDIS